MIKVRVDVSTYLFTESEEDANLIAEVIKLLIESGLTRHEDLKVLTFNVERIDLRFIDIL